MSDDKQKPKTKVDELRESLEKRRAAEEVTEAEDAPPEREQLMRVMADFENYRKRSERERLDMVRYSNEGLMREMLSSLDHMDQALSHIKQSANTEAKNMAMGVELVAKELTNSLEKFGLKPIEAVGKPFDAKVHEALQMVDAKDAEPGTIVAQHRRGYMLHDRLLRPALVDVVKEK